MLQPRGGLGLDLEAPAALRIERGLDGEGLDRDLAVERLVVAAVHHAHATAADAAGDQVAAECGGFGRASGALARSTPALLLEAQEDDA